ncbi:2-amino-3,7-dideoxy-D-threo-hept-6-ulosonate synthase [Moorellaceae bacterium AZ2]
MSHIGKEVRLNQIFNPESHNAVILAMDHAPVLGPIEGIVNPLQTVKMLLPEHPDSWFMPIGPLKIVYREFIKERVPFLLSIDTCTEMGPEPDYFMLTDSVEHAVEVGASGVCMHVMVGSPKTSDMIKGMSKVAYECDKWGMPLIGIMYPSGFQNDNDVKWVKWAARLGAELGADLIKTRYTGSLETFAEVVESCPVPILLSGGAAAATPEEYLTVLKNCIDAGGRGCAVGRNIWQYKDPVAMLRATKKIVHNGASVEEALRELGL